MDWPAPSAFLAVLRGFSPESAGYFKELDRLVTAIRATPKASALLTSDAAPADILAQLRGQPGEVGAAAQAYLDIVSYRLLDSLDTGDATAIEMPEVLLKGLRLAVEKGAPASDNAPAAEVARLREQVPTEHRAAFDELLAEARHMSRLRDERGLYSDVWAAGITRHALLAFGARLVAAGRLHEPAHVIECDPDEIRALLAGAAVPGRTNSPNGPTIARRGAPPMRRPSLAIRRSRRHRSMGCRPMSRGSCALSGRPSMPCSPRHRRSATLPSSEEQARAQELSRGLHGS